MLLKRAIKRRKLPGSDVVTLFPIRALSHVSGIASCSVVRKRWLRAREGWREIEGSFLDQRVFQPIVHRFSIVRLFLFLSLSIFFPQTKFPNFRRNSGSRITRTRDFRHSSSKEEKEYFIERERRGDSPGSQKRGAVRRIRIYDIRAN